MLVQALESRRHLDAPSAIGALVFSCEITEGTGIFADDGSFTFTAAQFLETFEIDGTEVGDPDFDGTFEYQQLDNDTGRVVLTAVEIGGEGTLEFTFTDDLEGTWRIDAPNDDFQEGTFEIIDGGTIMSRDGDTVNVFPTSGDDDIEVSVSGETITATRNNWTDTLSLESTNLFKVSGGDGFDELRVDSSISAQISGGNANDSIVGGSGDDTLGGNAGKDTIKGGSGDDRINGHGGHDKLYGQSGDDRIYGFEGNDRIDGGGNVDRAWGGNGNDLFFGGGSNDKLRGEDGDDTFFGQSGSDLIDGGDDNDTADDSDEDFFTSIEDFI